MTVYVDDHRAPYGRLKMCHMVADSDAELHAMADRIGVARRHYQGDHYDVCWSKRALAIKEGAVGVRLRTLGCMRALRRQRGTRAYPRPDDALAWQRQRIPSLRGTP